MIAQNPEELAAAMGATLAQKGRLSPIGQISTDTRTIRHGDLFACLAGDRFDGHRFARQAVYAGACGVLVNEDFQETFPPYAHVFRAPDTKRSLMALAAYQRLQFKGPVVAITGSHGKTSTKEWLRWLLSTDRCVLANEKNFNNELGVTYTWLALTPAHQCAVIEMGMRGPGQIKELCDITHPNIGLITAIGAAHAGELGGLEAVARAKLELFEALEPDALAVFPEGMGFQDLAGHTGPAKKWPVGKDDFYTSNITLHPDGATTFTLEVQGQSHGCRIPMWGVGQLQNAVLALAVATHLGLPLDTAIRRLADFPGLAERLELALIGTHSLLNDAYNASPDSMREALEVTAALTWFPQKRLVLGDMLELGKDAAVFHKDLCGAVLAVHPVKVYLAGPNMTYLAAALTENAAPFPIYCARDAAGLLPELLKDLRESAGDFVLLKSSHGTGLHTLAEPLKEALN